MKEDRKRIADQLYTARHRRRMSRAGMAHRLGVHWNTITRWELGERSIPAEIFIDYCFVLGLDPADVISRAVQERKPDR